MIRLLASVLLIILTQTSYADYPGDSVYLLQAQWHTQDSQKLSLGDFAGKKLVISMTYTSCQHTCPVIVSNMQTIEKTLSASDRDNVRFVLVSLLPRSDTPERLKAYATKRGLNGWTLLSGHEEDVRQLAMVLNVRYKVVGENEVAHSNLITILDEQGRVKKQLTGTESRTELAMQYLR